MSKEPSLWDVELTADNSLSSDTCVYLPPAALPNVKLPKRLLVRAPDGGVSKLVGRTRISGGDAESAIRVSPALLGELAPGKQNELLVAGTLRPAKWGDVYAYTEKEDIVKIIGAAATLVAAIIAAVAAFFTRETGVWIAAGLLFFACVAVGVTARSEIRDAVTPRCR